jgi:hypothetical protein
LFTLALASLIQATKATAQDSKGRPSDETAVISKPPGFNQQIYYRNNLEFSFETVWHPINIPFVYDFAVGGLTLLDGSNESDRSRQAFA